MQAELQSTVGAGAAADEVSSMSAEASVRETWLGIACAALLAGAFFLVYYPTIRTLTAYWASNDMYSYGFLVPFISGYLIWLRRDVLAQVARKPSFALGVPVLAGALLLFVVGRVSSTNLLEELSLPVTVFGIVLLVLGARVTKALLFPLAFLMTMIPFWDFFTNRLHLPFQLYSATIGVNALRAFDIPVFRSGIFIHLPNVTLEVADLCSGVNHLVAVLCIGVPITHLFVKRWPVRVFIVSTAIVIALLSNGLRVATVALFAYYGIRGPNGDIHGPYAVFRSLAISAVGFVVLFWLVSRFADAPLVRASARSGAGSRPQPPRGVIVGAAVALAIAMLGGTIAFTRTHTDVPVSLTAALVSFPNALGRWNLTTTGAPFSPRVDAVGFDQTLSRRYVAPDGTELDLLIGYFARQEQGRELVGYRMSRLLSQGHAAAGSWTVGNGRVSDFVTTVDGATYHIAYWYVVGDRVTSRAAEAKWLTTWNSITAGRSNGGIVAIKTRMEGDQPVELSRERVRDFVEQLMVAAGRYFPGQPHQLSSRK